MRRVVVTGMGMVTPLGDGVDTNWRRLMAAESGIRAIQAFDTSDLATKIAGEVPLGDKANGHFNADTYILPKDQRKLDKFLIFGIAAAQQAVEDSGWKPQDDEGRNRTGVMIGAGIGGLQTIYETSLILKERGPRRVSPFFIPSALINLASGQVSIKYGFKGPNHAVVTACATGAHAFVMGEGAGCVVLEEYEHAKKRGAKIYAEIVGYGLSGDAYHITAPSEDGGGAMRAMQAALKRAKLDVDQIDYVNAHGTSTMADVIELGAVKRTFGDSAYKLSMSSTKSATGHLLGAAGAIEAIYSIKSIIDQAVPPTLNLDEPDEGCDIDLVAKQAKPRKVRYALSNSFGFGGTNACLIFGPV